MTTGVMIVMILLLVFIVIPDVTSDVTDGCRRLIKNNDKEEILLLCDDDRIIEVTLMTKESLRINCQSQESSIGEETETLHGSNRSEVTEMDPSIVKIQNCHFQSEDSMKEMMTFLNVNVTAILKLELFSSNLRNISEDFLSSLESLVSLTLVHCDLEELNQSLFKDTKMLSTIAISNTSLKIIQESTFHDMDNLSDVSFEFNRISSPLPSTLFLKNNQFKTFELVQNYQNITELPRFKSSSLVVIDIQKSTVSSIPSSWLSGSKNLMMMTLKASMIKEVPENVFLDTKKLGLIDLSENLIQNLPRNIFSGLENLQFLFLNNNFIKHLDESLFVDTVSLRKLQLQHNDIGSLNDLLLRTTNHLEEINLSNNNLLSKDTECFKHQNLQHVRVIDLSFNKFYMINFNFFLMSKLQYLNLSHNAIGPVLSYQDIDFKLTFGLTVDLSFNSIEIVNLRDDLKVDAEISKGKYNQLILSSSGPGHIQVISR